jgi:predicted ATPase/DNA-binding SARP family transcriptional activator
VVELRLFGDFRLLLDGAEQPFRAPEKTRELLAFLLVRRDCVDRARIAETLWPDDDVEEGRANLRRHLYRLTSSALPGDGGWLAGDKRTVAWDAQAPALVDVATFDECYESEPERALAAYHGELLPALACEWIEAERERYRARAAALCANLARRALDERALDAAERFAARLAAIDPWDETAVRTIIATRSARGDAAGAAHAYNTFARRLSDELGVEPAPDTRAAYEAAVRITPTIRVLGPRRTTFVGRERELGEIAGLLDGNALVTLTGPGGVGKTRLVQELMRTASARTHRRIAFVRLAAIDDAAFVVGAIATALGVREEHAAPLIETIAVALHGIDVLLVVDNCEHLLDAAALAVEDLLSRLPRLRVVATSREPLRLDGEHVVRIAPLALGDAVALFTERAVAAGAVDAQSPAVSETIATICRRLDGLPLAIELAAAQSYAQRVATVAKSLDDDFGPSAARRTAEPRQRSLKALLDWSIDRLAPEERQAFAALGILNGSFSTRTADAVCATHAPLAALLAKSLVACENERYTLLETTRKHARNRLETIGDDDVARLRHLAHALVLAREAQVAFRGEQRPGWREPFLAELDNLRGVLDWALREPHARVRGIALAAELDVFFYDASLQMEGARWIERAVASLRSDDAPTLHARVLLAAAWLRPEGPGRIDAASALLARLDDLADDSERARACCAFAWSAQYIYDQRQAMARVLAEARTYAERADDAYAMALVMHLTGDVLLRAHRDVDAHAAYDDAVERYVALGDERGTAMVLANIAEGAFRRGELGEAVRRSSEALTIMRARGERQFALPLLANIAMYAITAGDVERAQTCADEGYAIANEASLAMETAIFCAIYAMLAAYRRDYAYATQLLGCTDRLYREGMFLPDHTEKVLVETLEERLRAEQTAEEFARNHAIGERRDPADLLVRTTTVSG